MGGLGTVERVQILRGVEFFTGVPGYVLAALADAVVEVDLRTGESLIERGEHGDSLYVVAAGSLAVRVGEHTVGTVLPGDVVGELAALVPEPRTATVTALEPGLVLRIAKPDLDEMLLDHPDVGLGIIRTLVRRLRERNAALNAAVDAAASGASAATTDTAAAVGRGNRPPPGATARGNAET